MKTLDLTKPMQTVDGQPVEIISTKARGDYPIIGYIGKSNSESKWAINGKYYLSEDDHHELNIFNVPERIKRTVWINIYSDDSVVIGYRDKNESNLSANAHRTACIKVELDFEEGEGL